MLLNRIIPVLLLNRGALVKTIRFRNPAYVGDPLNILKIFIEKSAPEIIVLDIAASEQQPIDYALLDALAGECFVPLTYGGGIRSVDNARRIFDCGIEKIALNTAAIRNPRLIYEAAKIYGSQSITVSIDVVKMANEYSVYNKNLGRIAQDPSALAHSVQENGAGEILLNSKDRDGTMDGYDTEIIRKVSDKVKIPVIACGGAGCIGDLRLAIASGAAAAAAGSMFVFHGVHRAVLVNFDAQTLIND